MITLDNIKGHENLSDTVAIALANLQANLHTQTVAKITKINSITIDVKPVINRVVNDKSIELPVFIEVPPIFLLGGSSSITMPLAVGDYCLLFFNERCFDRWYFGNDFQPPLEHRMHDYSDGFALVGLMPQTTALSIPDKITIQGDCQQNGDYTHAGNRTQNGNFTQTGDYTITGDVRITGKLYINDLDFELHKHSQGDDSGGNTEQDTGGPIV